MLFRNLIVLALALSSGVAAVRTERGSSLRKAEDVKERALDGKGSRCGKSEEEFEEYYNALFEIDDEKNEALCNCTDDDMFAIGGLLREIVEKVDKAFPKLEEVRDVKEIDTEVCEMPCVWDDPQAAATSDRRLGRRKRRWTYKSGGTCLRCTTGRLLSKVKGTTAHLLSKVKIPGRGLEDQDANSMAAAACDYAQVTQSAYEESHYKIEKVTAYLEKLIAWITVDDAIKKCEEAEKFITEMLEDAEEMLEDIDIADKACSDALVAAAQNDEKKAEDCLKDAEDAAKDCMDKLEKVEKGEEDAKKKQKEANAKEIEDDVKKDKERVKEVIEKMKDENEKKIEAIDVKIKQCQEDIKQAKSLLDAKEIAFMEADLKVLKLEKESQKKALKLAEKELEDYHSDKNKYNEALSNLLLEAEYAKDYEGMLCTCCGFDSQSCSSMSSHV